MKGRLWRRNVLQKYKIMLKSLVELTLINTNLHNPGTSHRRVSLHTLRQLIETRVPYVTEGLTYWRKSQIFGWWSNLIDWRNRAYAASLVLFVICFFRMKLDTASGKRGRLFFPMRWCSHRMIQGRKFAQAGRQKLQSQELRPAAQAARQKPQHTENYALKVIERKFLEGKWGLLRASLNSGRKQAWKGLPVQLCWRNW